MKAIAFTCNWCSYAGADLAGLSRLEHPPIARVIRFMCSGRIDPIFVIAAFLEGADGVLISGCHIGDCHYINGNHKTRNRYEFLKEFFDELGLEPERLRLEWISASEGEKWARVMTELDQTLSRLGKSPLRPRILRE